MDITEFENWLRTLHSKQYYGLSLRVGMPPQIAKTAHTYVFMDHRVLEQPEILEFAQYLLRLAGNAEAPENTQSLNFVINSLQLGTFRIQLFQQRNSLAIFIFTRDLQVSTLADLQCDEETIDSLLKSDGCTLVCGTDTHKRIFSIADFTGRYSTFHPVLICHRRTYETPHQVTIKEIGVDTSSYEEALLEAQNFGANIIITDDLPTPEAANHFLHLWERGCCVVAAIPTPDNLSTDHMTQLLLSRLPRPARLRGALLFDQRNFFVWNQGLVQVETGEINWKEWM